MLYRLIILNGDRRSERITITQAPMTIGRGEACEIRFNDPEIALAHAQISHTPEGLFIRDLDSMNRLLLNNREVREAHPKHGDVVEVGHTRFLVQAYVQAEVQGNEADSPNRKPWFIAASALLAIVILVAIIRACTRTPAVLPSRLSINTRVASGVKSASAVPNVTVVVQPAPAAPVPAAAGTSTPARTSQGQPAKPPKNSPPKAPPEETNPGQPLVSPPVDTPPATTPEMAEATVLMANRDTNATTDVIAAAQQELQDAAKALLQSKVNDMLDEARTLAASNGPAAAESLLASIERISPDTLEASVMRAELLENQGKLDPALALWNDIQRRGSNTAYAARAEAKALQLERARTELVFPFVGRIKIVDASLSKFPETDQYQEMRLLNIRLVATEFQKQIDSGAVRIETRFYDRDPETDKIELTHASVPSSTLTVSGAWRATEERTVQSSYVVPAGDHPVKRTRFYHGFIVRVYYYGALQDERVQPRDLPADVELAVPVSVPATNQTSVVSTNVNLS
jgi:hypothetical protein